MKMNSWMRVGAIGFAASLFVAGCVVNSTTDNGDGGAGTGGATGGTGGTSTGGTGGSTGGTAGTGGTSTGGSGGAITCNPSDPNNTACDTCMQTTCCTEWEACQANAHCPKEFTCISNCIAAVINDAGTATQNDKIACAGQCADTGSSTIDQTTNDLFACANNPAPEAGTSCAQDCFGG